MTAILSISVGVLAALPAAARPYLMLFADDKGFEALDIGDFVRTPASPYADDRILRPAPPAPPAGAPKPAAAAKPAPASLGEYDGLLAYPPPKPKPPRNAGAAPGEGALAASDEARPETVSPYGPRLRDPRTQGLLAPGEGAARIIPRAAPHPLFVPDTVEATLISAPLAGAPYGDKLAPMVKQRAEFDCRQPRWRVLSRTYADAHEAVLATADTTQEWLPLDVDEAAAAAQAALCRRQYSQTAVSRFLNVGEILANYQAAHGVAAPQPKTREQLLAERFKNNR